MNGITDAAKQRAICCPLSGTSGTSYYVVWLLRKHPGTLCADIMATLNKHYRTEPSPILEHYKDYSMKRRQDKA